MEAIYTGEIRH
jgi:hypothetical protein